jgi:hypothetical protein
MRRRILVLPNGGGYEISGLYNLVPTKVGLVDELAQSYKNFAQQTENWQGVDFSVVARMRNGLTVQGGTSTDAGLPTAAPCAPSCPSSGPAQSQARRDPRRIAPSRQTSIALGGGPYALSTNNPYCRIEEPYRTDFRGLATYIIPKVDVQVAATWASIPGDSLRATSSRPTRDHRPGRSRSAGR